MKLNFLKRLFRNQKLSKQISSKKGYLFYLFGEALSKGIVFLLLGFFTNNLNKTEFGILSLIWVSIPLLSVLIDFSQRSFVKSAYINEPSNIGNTIVAIKCFCCVVALVWILIALIKDFLGIYLISSKVDYLLLLAAFFYALIELQLSLYQIQGAFKKYNLFFLLRNVSPYLGVALIYLCTSYDDAVQYLYVHIAFGFVIVLYFFLKFDYSMLGKLGPIKQILKTSLKFSFPLLPAMISVLALSFSDRFIINYYYSETEVAEYTVAYTISSIFIAFFMATNKMWQKIILEGLKENDIENLSIKARKYILAVIIVGLGIALFSKSLLLFMSNDSYLIVLDLIPILVLGMFFYFLYTVLSNIPFFHGNTMLQALPALIAALLNIFLNFLLLPKFGYKVAAITTGISYFLEFMIIYLICRKKYNIDLIFNAKRAG